MKEISESELRDLQLAMIKKIDKFCLENDIRYWLCNGSLLGAVRHKGYIPWDDDIDIVMPDVDYERFISIFGGTFAEMHILSYPQCRSWYLPHAKVVDSRTLIREQHCLDCDGTGVYIDVFPLTGLPNTAKKAKAFINKNKRLVIKNQFKRMMRYDFKSLKGIVKSCIKGALQLLPKGYYVGKIQKLHTKYAFCDSELVGVAFGYRGEKEIFDAEIFNGTARLKFEDTELNVPIGYERYLTRRFGNYKELPPIEERVTHHGFKAYWKS